MTEYKPVKKKMTNLKNRPKHYKGEKFKWILKTKNEKGKVVKKQVFNSLFEIAKAHKTLSYDSWRNFSIGRASKYNDLYELTKEENLDI